MELPKLEDLYADRKPDSGTLLELLMQPANPDWVEKHPIYTSHEYLPIDKVLKQLTNLFGATYTVEVLRESIYSSIAWAAVRVHFQNKDSGKMDFWDGASACKISKGTHGASEEAALQIAISDAIKDACGRWPLFGSELNRDKPKGESIDIHAKMRNLYDEKLPLIIKSKISQEEKDGLKRIVDNKEKQDYDKAFAFLNGLK